MAAIRTRDRAECLTSEKPSCAHCASCSARRVRNSVRILADPVLLFMSSDAELLRRSRAGHKDAFAGLVERYQNLVCAVTFGGTGDRDMAADLAQETFVAAWTSLPTLREESRFRSWLCGIARNLVGKAKRRRVPGALGPEVTATVADPSPTADETLATGESEALLREILDGMDESFREPLVLYYWEGRSTKEVAARLGLSNAAVEQRLSRGRRKIKAEVEDRVDRALQAAKPNKRFAALVVAALPTMTPPATAHGWGRPAAALVGVAALGVGTWLAVQDTGQPGPTTRANAAAVVSPAAPSEAAPAPRHQASPEEPATAGVSERPSRGAHADAAAPAVATGEIADSIEMERFPNRVVVNLRGGASVMSDEQRQRLEGGAALARNADGPITDAPTRTIRGTVTDGEGRPITGAAVVAGGHVHRASVHGVDHQLTGQAGAMTDAAGRFSFDASTRAILVTAAATGEGFAESTTVEAGEEAVELELVMVGHGGVAGQLLIDDEPVDGYVVLRSSQGADRPVVESQHRTDEGGYFHAELLPPGRYRMFAEAGSSGYEQGVSDQGPRTWLDVEIRAGEVTARDVALERGLTIEFRATEPGRLTYYAFAGVELDAWDQASPLLNDPDVASSSVSSTPDDDETFAVIQGLPHDVLTVCAVRPHPLFEPTTYAECRSLPKPEVSDATIAVMFEPTDG